MSKKRQSRKSKRQGRTATVGKSRSASREITAETFNPDYSQTIKDLKRIGVLAGTFFMILIGLAFFLR